MNRPITALAGIALAFAIFAPSLRAANSIGAMVQATDYDAVNKVTTVHILNTSLKEISAIDLSIQVTFADGTQSLLGSSFQGADFLGGITNGGGGIAPGATFDQEFRGQEGPVHATIDVVIYTDGTADVLNESVFKSLIADRKGRVRGLQKVDELLSAALADPAVEDPGAATATQLKSLVARAKHDGNTIEGTAGYEGELQGAIQNLSHAPAGRSEREDTRLRAYIKTNEQQISLILPHTEVTSTRPT